MNILLLNDDYPPYASNSVAEITHTQAKKFTALGHSVTVLTTHRKEDNPQVQRDKQVISIPVSYKMSLRHWLSIHNRSVSKMLNEILKEVQPDIIQAHNIHTYLTYDSLRIARKYTDKIFLTMHDVMSFSFGRLATDKYLESKGSQLHLSPYHQYKQVRLMWNPIRNICIKKALTNVSKIIAVSKALEDALHANGILNTIVIHHGINTTAWKSNPKKTKAFRNSHNLNGKKIILFGGRLSIDKGGVALLHALEKIIQQEPLAMVLIIGDKKKWGELMSYANASKEVRSHCVCTGWIHTTELPVAFDACDIVTTPSLCLDTFNLMNLEAMAASKPVVGTIFGGTPEVVKHNVTGFICDPRDTEIYANHLLNLLQNPAKAKSMGEAGQKRAGEQFSLQGNIEKYLNLFTVPNESTTL